MPASKVTLNVPTKATTRELQVAKFVRFSNKVVDLKGLLLNNREPMRPTQLEATATIASLLAQVTSGENNNPMHWRHIAHLASMCQMELEEDIGQSS